MGNVINLLTLGQVEGSDFGTNSKILDKVNDIIDHINSNADYFATPLATTTALMALTSDTYHDKMMCLVENKGLYRFDAESTDAAVTDEVLVPDDITAPAPGRWIRIAREVATSLHTQGTDQGLDTGGANAVTAANAKDAVTKKHTQGTDQGLDTGGANASTAADVKDAVTKKHTQGTDQGLDTGGANAVVVADVKDAVTKKHTQGTDQGLDTGGANASTAADVKDAVTKKHTVNTDTYLDFGGTNEISAANVMKADGTKNFTGWMNLNIESFAGHVNTNCVVIDLCDALNMNQIDSALIFDGSLDNTTFRKGTGSTKLDSLTSDPVGDHKIYRNIAPAEDWSLSNRIGFWFFANRTLGAGNVQLYLRDNVGGEYFVNLPAYTVASVWVWIELDISGVGVITAINRIGFKRNIDLIFTAQVDHIYRFDIANISTLAEVPQNFDNVCRIFVTVSAAAGANDQTLIAEDTDYILGVTTRHIIYLTDQSLLTCMCYYLHA